MNRISPAVSITRLAEGDLTFPEVDGSRFFLTVDTIPPVCMVSHLYSLHPNILKSHNHKFYTLTYQFLRSVMVLSTNLIQNIKILKWCGYICMYIVYIYIYILLKAS